jgi:glycogen debranching enzyme
VPAANVDGIDVGALVRVLCEIGRVEDLADLGSNGPLLASAGAHSLFHCLFGRDAIRMAMDLLEDFPAVARATLLDLARLQGVEYDLRREEEPGRILHEFRAPDDPYAIRLRAAGWDFPYYGAVDTTPQWINLLGAYCARHGLSLLDEPLIDRAWRPIVLRDSLLAAVAWIVGRLDDPRGGGYLWVRRTASHGIINQVWEDSSDSHFHADGSLFEIAHPFAPVAVQGYAHDALLAAADLLERSPGPLPFDARWLRSRAWRLRERLLVDFWQPDMDTFAHALTVDAEGRLRPARVVASSAGHLLAGQVLHGRDARSYRKVLIARLRASDMLGGAGIRTKSTTAARFRAGAYHNGSIWPMDSGLIAEGLRSHGARAAAGELEQRILDACRHIGGFPEFMRGDIDGTLAVNREILDAIVDGVPNRLEQPPQSNQGWTATRVWRILRRRGVLGTDPHAAV